jgi:hypothetical protein
VTSWEGPGPWPEPDRPAGEPLPAAEPVPPVEPAAVPIVPDPALVVRTERPRRARPEQEVVAWARAIWGGLKDTAHDMMEAGRHESEVAYREGWARFDAKTKFRRDQPPGKSKKRK